MSPPSQRRRRATWRTALVAVLTLATAGGVAVLAQGGAQAATVDPSAFYVLVSRHSGKAIDLFNFNTADGAPIVQWARNDGNQQQWQFVDAGGGYYKVRSRLSGKVLE